MLHRFFNYHIDLTNAYREKFNSINPDIKIFKRSYIKVVSVSSEEFFDEIEKFVLIKEAFVIKDIESGNINNEGIEYLTRQAKENNVEDFQEMKVTFRNNVKKRGIKHIKSFFKNYMKRTSTIIMG